MSRPLSKRRPGSQLFPVDDRFGAMPRKSFSVLIVPHDHRAPLRQVSMTRRFFVGAASALTLVFALALVLPSYFANPSAESLVVSVPAPAPKSPLVPPSSSESHDLQKMAQENEALRGQVFKMARKIEDLSRTMEEFESLADVDLGPDAVAAGGVQEDNSLDFENPDFFGDDPASLAKIEMEKADFWKGLFQERIQARVILAGSTPNIWPLRGGLAIHGYRWRTDPFTRKPAFHRGLDIAARRGTPVFATADGLVTYAAWHGGYGKTIDLAHTAGISTRYGHLDRFLVQKGQKVNKGQVIGEVGSTGRSTGPHLHYEVLEFGRAMNPMMYVEDLRSELARR